jgi:transmembrane 9 superfamily protein 3
LGEALQGYELIKSPLLLEFKKDKQSTVICTKVLSEKDVEQFIYAIKNQYWYQLFLDDLPVWGMVGEVLEGDATGGEKLYIYTHQKFVITYNNDRVIEVNLTSENPVALSTTANLAFTYSVSWHPTSTPFEARFDKYLDDSFFEHQIHWFSIFNSFMMVIFLTGLVSIILMRTLRKDYARIAREVDEFDDDGGGDELGWKQIHGDVFRAPSHLMLFSALLGSGHQLILLVFSVLFLSILGTYYRSRGAIVTAFVICYTLTSFIAGYAGGSFYQRNNGKNWIKNMLITACLFPGVCFSIAFVLDLIAVGYGSLSSIPIGTMFIILFIWLGLSVPLTVAGTVVGKNYNGQADNPCKINQVPRQIPERKWYLQPWVNVVLGGILPFGSIFIEMYFIFTSFWHYKYYYVYGFMLLVYIILIIVSVCVTIVSTYFLLNAEDYRWQWVSFLSSGSTAVYVYLYSIYYFFFKTKMSGFFQTTFYFGYMLMFCFGLFVLCGAIGFIGTSVFVRRIYRLIKME